MTSMIMSTAKRSVPRLILNILDRYSIGNESITPALLTLGNRGKSGTGVVTGLATVPGSAADAGAWRRSVRHHGTVNLGGLIYAMRSRVDRPTLCAAGVVSVSLIRASWVAGREMEK